MAIRERRESNGLVWLESELLSGQAGVAHGFSTRLGGVSRGHFSALNLGHTRGDDPAAVRENYRRFCQATGAGEVERLVLSHQVHKDHIRVCTMADAGKGLDRERGYDADGLMTNVPGLPLVIFSADCIPILLYDPVNRAAAACHAGWRGTAQAIAQKTVRQMTEVYGSKPGDLRAAVGPGIGPCCFITHSDVTEAMFGAFGDMTSDYVNPIPETDQFHVDLKGINAALLRAAGVERIDVSSHCTGCRQDLFWSHRFVGNARGSMAAVIMIKEG